MVSERELDSEIAPVAESREREPDQPPRMKRGPGVCLSAHAHHAHAPSSVSAVLASGGRCACGMQAPLPGTKSLRDKNKVPCL